MKGKLSYMAPEQVTNQLVDRRTDVYAAAVCLWEALTGTKLFHGGSEGAIVNQILREPPRPPIGLNRAIPAALDAVVMRGLARDPSGRFASARDMALAIERATPLATAAEVGELVTLLGDRGLSERALLISNVERSSSSSNMRDAVDSLRTLANSRQDSSRQHAVSHGPIATLPPAAPLPVPVLSARPGVSLPPTSAAAMRGSGRVIGVVAGSAALIVAILAVAGYVLVAKRKVVTGVVVTSSATIVGDGGRGRRWGRARARVRVRVRARRAVPTGWLSFPAAGFSWGRMMTCPPSGRRTRSRCMPTAWTSSR